MRNVTRTILAGIALLTLPTAHGAVIYAAKGLFSGRVTIANKAPNTTYTLWQTVRARGGAYVAMPHTITTDGAGNGTIAINNNDATPLTKHRLIKIGTASAPDNQPPDIVVLAQGVFGTHLYASFNPGMNGPMTLSLANTVATNAGPFTQTWNPGTTVSILLNPAQAQWINMGAFLTTTGDLQAQILNIGPAAITVQIISDPTPLSNDEIKLSNIGVNCSMPLDSRFPIRMGVQGTSTEFVNGIFMANHNWPVQTESLYDHAVVAPAGTILPDLVEVLQGDLFDGDTDELLFSDNTAVMALNDSLNLNTEFQVTGRQKGPISSFLNLVVELSIDRPGMVVQTRALNSSGNFLPVDGRVAPTVNTALNIPLGLSFLPVDGVVKAQIQFAPINDEDPAQDGWMARLERVRWLTG